MIPSFIESHGHGADEGLDTGGRLVVGRAESASNVLVVEYLNFEGEIFLQLYQRVNNSIINSLTFLMIMTKKGSLMPRVLLASAGHVM